MLMRVTSLMQDCGREASKSMARHPSLIAHALQPFEYGVVAHRLLCITVARKNPFTVSSESPKNSQYLQRLSRQRHNMGSTHFHALGGDVPTGGFQIELSP